MSDEMAQGIEESLYEKIYGDTDPPNNEAELNEQGERQRDAVGEWASLYYAAGQIIAVRWPAVGLIYTPDRCESLQKSLHPIFEKWGLNEIAEGGGLMAEVLPYLVAGAAIISIGKDTLDAVRRDQAQQAQGVDVGEGGERCA
jgi:hypothetical protein